MQLLLTYSLSLAMGLLPMLSWLPSVPSANPDTAPQSVHEEINKTVTLAPGAQVKISGINGSVNVETWNGNQAEIHITITASDRAALDRRPLLIEDTGNSLTIRTDDHRDRGWGSDHGEVRHQVRLRLPNNIHLNVSGVNGGVDVGQITGAVAVSGVNGGVNVAQAGSATKLTGINGRVSVALASLGQDGLHISGINGGIELRIPAATNAELNVHGINGGVSSDLQMTIVGTARRGELHGTLGSGGPIIDVSGVNGGLHLKRL